MMAATTTCPIIECHNTHGPALEMCYEHWRRVPADMKTEIASLKKGSPEYALAVFRAIQYAGVADGG